MKTGIHPKYIETQVTCGCGNTFTTRSTTEKIVVEICSNCHPFYTGKQKFVDTAGRVDKFKKKWGSLEDRADKKAKRKAKRPQIRRAESTMGLKSLPVQKTKGPPPKQKAPTVEKRAPAPPPKPQPKPEEKPAEQPKTKPDSGS